MGPKWGLPRVLRQGAQAIAVKLLRPAVVADVRRLDVVGVGLVGPNEEVLLGQPRVGFDAGRVLGSGLRLKNSEALSAIAESSRLYQRRGQVENSSS